VLSKFGSSHQGEAKIRYLDNDLQILSQGAFVRCAVTNAAIPLDELKYWSVDLQEAYAHPDAMMQRHYPSRLAKPASA